MVISDKRMMVQDHITLNLTKVKYYKGKIKKQLSMQPAKQDIPS
jgi:hypothetical protein